MYQPRPVIQRQVLPPRIHPTCQNVQYNCCEYIVPEVHPSHTTIVNKHLYKHCHQFPHTTSVVNQVGSQHFVAPPTFAPPVVVAPFAGQGVAPFAGQGVAPAAAPRRFF
ncbi:MAG: spore coat protein [Bacillaceae bacterium]|nr:spore coat protein [Bacillaceae bacterium]